MENPINEIIKDSPIPISPVYVTPPNNESIELSTEPIELEYENQTFSGEANITMKFQPKPDISIKGIFPNCNGELYDSREGRIKFLNSGIHGDVFITRF